MRATPGFGDPKTGFIFQRIFTWRSEDHKTALLGFLNVDLATLRRWHDQAIFAESAAQALR